MLARVSIQNCKYQKSILVSETLGQSTAPDLLYINKGLDLFAII